MVSHPGGTPIMDVDRINDVLIVEGFEGFSPDDFHGFGSPRDTIMTIVDDITINANTDAQHGTLLYFHQCFGHLSCDTTVKMTRNPASGIKLTDTKRVNCLACAQGKQTKNLQFRMD